MKSCPICDTAYPDQHTTCPTDGAVLIVSHELAPGSLVRGKYRIVSKLGQGGMGVVYLAEHLLLGGNAALKFLAGDLGKDPKFIKRFRMEARAAHQLRHPNIVEVTDLDQSEDGSLFIALEYVAGKSLRAALDEERSGFSVPRALELTRGIVSGLAAAHAHGTVHRDVKPENVLLAHTADGRELPKVLDFGIAAMADSATQSNMTRGLLLTPGYAAPEQWMEMPAAEMDGRTDLYALGCVFFEMLTGRTPFHAHNMESCRRQHMEETPRLPSELRPELADWTGLDGLVMRLLAKNRNDRPQDAEALSLLDSVQIAPGQEWQKTVAASAWERPQTISEEGQGWQTVVPLPIAQPVMQPVSQPVFQPVSQPVIQAPKPTSQKVPGWVWGALAVVVVAAGFAAVHFFAPKPQSEQTQASATQPVVIPPRQAGSYTYTAPNPTTAQQKPSPGSKTDTTPAAGGPASPQTPNPTQADNTKPSIVLPNVVLPKQIVLPQVVKPPVPQPSINDLTQQAVALYGQKRFSEASPLFDKACSGGGWEACKDLGIMYRYGQGVTEDDLRAAGLYSKACDGAPPKGCNSLGEMYANGKGVAKDVSRAATFYSKACDANDAMGCSNLGSMYWYGRGVSPDDTRAAALYSKACDNNNAAGCSSLGLCYGTGRGVAKDPAKAREQFTKGCKMGNQWGCDLLKKLK
jgi:serine/threonine-protein kinase